MEIIASVGWKVLPEIDLGPLSVSPHGIGIAIGYAAGGALLARRAERMHGIKRDDVWNMLMWAVLGVIVGARMFYVVGHIGDYFPNVLDIFKIRQGGIVFYGGVFGGIVAAVPYMRKHQLPFWKLMDAAAPGFPLGLIFGRIGDLVIGDHLGTTTSMPWGFRYEGGYGCVPADCLPDRVLPIGTVVHQTALYDWVNVLILFPVVLLLSRKRRPDGWLILFVATWYGGFRFLEDFARTSPTYLGFSGTQWVSLTLIVVGGALLVRRARAPIPAEPSSGGPGEDTEPGSPAEAAPGD